MILRDTPNWVYLLLALLLFALLFVCFVIAKYHKTVIAILTKIPRDAEILRKFFYWKIIVYIQRRQNQTMGSIFESISRKRADKVALYFENENWTFEQIDKTSNRLANYFYSNGFRKGDCAAIFMENCPQFIFTFLGLSKIGVKLSLINTNLRLKSLKHSLECIPIKAIIFSTELAPAVDGVKIIGALNNVALFTFGKIEKESYPGADAMDLSDVLKDASWTKPPESESPNHSDDLCYVFTSGTTGLPKAVIIKHSKYVSLCKSGEILHSFRATDLLYVCLPLYHSSGIMAGVGQLLVSGYPVALRKKFSANNFFSDCKRYNATIGLYIGELCRYLMSMSPSAADVDHKVRLLYGNGLRADIWEVFRKRFNIPQINEFYSSTEGNCGMVNIDNKIGAVGFIPRYATRLNPICLVKVDDETGEILRHPTTGMVFRCGVGHPGELIGKIIENVPERTFDGNGDWKEKIDNKCGLSVHPKRLIRGLPLLPHLKRLFSDMINLYLPINYADKSSTSRKILKDVFTKGDAWFRTGDLMVMDIYGYFYFKDRTGDTFRWKGENVSTFEVESVISSICHLNDVAVYGVEIPGCEGRAGMAAIADGSSNIDLHKLSEGLRQSLPYYAVPLFIRIVAQLEVTGTFKLKKQELLKEGFDIHRIQDCLYFLKDGIYVPLDLQLHTDIISAKLRL